MDKAPDAFRTISEVADDLDLPQHVLRFWETRFIQIRPMKRGGGRRFYRREDVELLRGVKHLLYGEGYTIRGVQRILKDNGIKFVQNVWQAGAPQPAKQAAEADEPPQDVAVSAEPAPQPRARGLFGILPARRDDEADEGMPPPPSSVRIHQERVEPAPTPRPLPAAPRVAPVVATPALRPDAARQAPASESRQPANSPSGGAALASSHGPEAASTPAGLPREHRRRLQSTLYELTECRRLIDAAMDGKP